MTEEHKKIRCVRFDDVEWRDIFYWRTRLADEGVITPSVARYFWHLHEENVKRTRRRERRSKKRA